MTTPGTVSFPLYTVDAFTDEPFGGNQAAVCLDSQGLSVELMQSIGMEMNLSETSFITLTDPESSFNTGSHFGLRWFTPTVEIPLCGHATLAAAAVLYNVLGNPSESIRFTTQTRGDLIVRRDRTSSTSDGRIVMDFPLGNPVTHKQEDYSKLVQTIVGSLPVQEVTYCDVTNNLMIVLTDDVTRKQIESFDAPNGTDVMNAHHKKFVGVIVTSRGDTGTPHHFYSRYFAPWSGVPEDPVTGSAHTVSAPYWAERLGRKQLKARQVSKRGGELDLLLRDDGRLDISGSSKIIISGTIRV